MPAGTATSSSGKERLPRTWVVHPFLVGVWPVLALFAVNAAKLPLRRIAMPALCLFLISGCAFFLLRLALKNSHKAGLIVTGAVILFFCYEEVFRIVARVSVEGLLCLYLMSGGAFFLLRRSLKTWHKAGLIVTGTLILLFSYRISDIVLSWKNRLHQFQNIDEDFTLNIALPLFWAACLILGAIRISRIQRDLSNATKVANFASVFLVLWPTVQIAWIELTLKNEIVGVDRELNEILERVSPKLLEQGNAELDYPDIYYIIFDRYASAAVLKSSYRFDNSMFLNFLRNKGFYIAEDSRTGYARTIFSIWASLNMRHHPKKANEGNVVDSLWKGHDVGRFLKSLGYYYIHLGCNNGISMECQLADEETMRVNYLSEFTLQLLFMTPLPRWTHFKKFWSSAENRLHKSADFQHSAADRLQLSHAEYAQRQISRIKEASTMSRRKFVFAHILLPHDPFVFSADGPLEHPAPDSKKAYLEQLQYTNRLAQDVVETILANSQRSPIIVIQADEGPYLREDDKARSPEDKLWIRTSILNAYHLPDGGEKELYPTISPVNTFRVILRHYFNIPLPLLKDTVFIWGSKLSAETGETAETEEEMGSVPFLPDINVGNYHFRPASLATSPSKTPKSLE